MGEHRGKTPRFNCSKKFTLSERLCHCPYCGSTMVLQYFDTVDHDILIRRLLNCFRISGKPLEWLRSFLAVFWGPLGLIGSPLRLVCFRFIVVQAYILYTADITILMASCSVLNQLYADDIQAYLNYPASNALNVLLGRRFATMKRSMEMSIRCR